VKSAWVGAGLCNGRAPCSSLRSCLRTRRAVPWQQSCAAPDVSGSTGNDRTAGTRGTAVPWYHLGLGSTLRACSSAACSDGGGRDQGDSCPRGWWCARRMCLPRPAWTSARCVRRSRLGCRARVGRRGRWRTPMERRPWTSNSAIRRERSSCDDAFRPTPRRSRARCASSNSDGSATRAEAYRKLPRPPAPHPRGRSPAAAARVAVKVRGNRGSNISIMEKRLLLLMLPLCAAAGPCRLASINIGSLDTPDAATPARQPGRGRSLQYRGDPCTSAGRARLPGHGMSDPAVHQASGGDSHDLPPPVLCARPSAAPTTIARGASSARRAARTKNATRASCAPFLSKSVPSLASAFCVCNDFLGIPSPTTTTLAPTSCGPTSVICDLDVATRAYDQNCLVRDGDAGVRDGARQILVNPADGAGPLKAARSATFQWAREPLGCDSATGWRSYREETADAVSCIA